MFDHAPGPVPARITALPHRKGDGVDRLLAEAAAALREAGVPVAGVIQHARPGQADCCDDFLLEDLATGTRHEISQRLGPAARGCRLDHGRLAEAHGAVARSLDAGAAALILNRFGYAEARGRGLRPLIERAVTTGIPVLISVNDSYRAEWHAFCADFARDIPASRAAVRAWAAAVGAACTSGKGSHG